MEKFIITTRNDSNVFQDLETIKEHWTQSVATTRPAVGARFREFVADAAYDMHAFKGRFDEVDRALVGRSAAIYQSTCELLLREQRGEFYAFIDDLVRTIRNEFYTPSQNMMDDAFARYWRGVLRGYLLESPIHFRTIQKPRGYAGDYEMMRMIYDDQYEGASIFGRLLHKYSMSTAAANCGRNRRKLLRKVLAEEAAHHAGPQPFRAASVACGAAAEIADFVRAGSPRPNEFMLLDQDIEALEEAKRSLLEATATGQAPAVHLVQDSVFSILKARNPAQKFGSYDLVYSVGLFDYLEDRLAAAMVKKLYDMVVPGGTLIIGNLAAENPDRAYMEYFMDWYLVYRTPENFSNVLSELPAGIHTELLYDETRIQMFLKIQKVA